VLCVQDAKTGNFPIHIAAQNGHRHIVKMLIDAGANVNAQNNNGLTALHMSVEYDYYFTSKVLLEAGADGEIVSGEVRARRPPSVRPSARPSSTITFAFCITGSEGMHRHRGRKLHRGSDCLLLRASSPRAFVTSAFCTCLKPPRHTGCHHDCRGRTCARDGKGQPGGVSACTSD
jgi:hypothetical protein